MKFIHPFNIRKPELIGNKIENWSNYASRVSVKIVFLSLIGIANGCTHSSFKYTNEYDISETMPGPLEDVDWVSAEAGGSIFESCEAINKRAVDKIFKTAKMFGDKRITKIQWYNESTEVWSSDPGCYTRYIGLAGAFFFLGWDNATTIKLRVKLSKSIQLARLGRREFGAEESSYEAIRQKHSTVVKYGLGMFGGYFEVGNQQYPNLQLHVEKNVWPSAKYDDSGYTLIGWDGVFITSQYFFAKNYHLKFGLGLLRKEHQYIDVSDDTKTIWIDHLGTALFAFSYERTLRKGLIYGVDWVSVNIPLALAERRGEIHPSQSHHVRTFQHTLRVFTLKIGVAF